MTFDQSRYPQPVAASLPPTWNAPAQPQWGQQTRPGYGPANYASTGFGAPQLSNSAAHYGPPVAMVAQPRRSSCAPIAIVLGIVGIVGLGFVALLVLGVLAGAGSSDYDAGTTSAYPPASYPPDRDPYSTPTRTPGRSTGRPTPGSTPGGGQRTDSNPVPPADQSPSEIPAPETYTEATAWMNNNSLYSQPLGQPGSCALSGDSRQVASLGELQAIFNEYAGCLTQLWQAPLTGAGWQLPRPPVTIYTSAITTACGKAETQNAFYCGADQRIYYDPSILDVYPPEVRRAKMTQEAIISHEFSHAIQARAGIMAASVVWEEKTGGETAEAYSRRQELQADCLSGVSQWAFASQTGLNEQDLGLLARKAYHEGDDVLTGHPGTQPDKAEHGLGRNRQSWFTRGVNATELSQCNTYRASGSETQ